MLAIDAVPMSLCRYGLVLFKPFEIAVGHDAAICELPRLYVDVGDGFDITAGGGADDER